MKSKVLKMMLFFSFIIVTSCKAQCDNKLANQQFKKDLEVISNSINNPNSNLKDLPLIIDRLEKITLIESVSDGNYFGKLHPTQADVQKWKDWLTTNGDNLCWDDKENTFYIKK